MRNMRFLAISSLLLTVTLSVSAQFKVNSDGKVIMHRATVDTLSDVSIGESSLIEDYSADKKALRIHKYLPQSGNCYGIYSEALKTSNKDGDAVGKGGAAKRLRPAAGGGAKDAQLATTRACSSAG